MVHWSEDAQRLKIISKQITSQDELLKQTRDFNDVCVIRLPTCSPEEPHHTLDGIKTLLAELAFLLGPKATLVIIGEIADLVRAQVAISSRTRYQSWIAVKRANPRTTDALNRLPQSHFGVLIRTAYNASLKHTKTRIKYSYCPACGKTTKDYGGKKHTYHEYGTLMSDVWRDIPCDLEGDISPIIDRLADIFGIYPYKELRVFDTRPLDLKRSPPDFIQPTISPQENASQTNRLINGDCLEELRQLPDNTVDFVFTDPPYNVGKQYLSYDDDQNIADYFSWCDEWLTELARILKPGRTLAVLNIPLWATRHFVHLESILQFQNWVAWDALSLPVRRIMPAHYTILCFTKGTSRPLPGLIGSAGQTEPPFAPATFKALSPLAEGYCLRAVCVSGRQTGIDDREPLTDLWGDIHRIKHNTRRVDHPTQLPPSLMYRLISIFTEPDELVLDCFNGSGTTTLAAHQLGRQFIGIELDEHYHRLAQKRHSEVDNGLDPFRKTNGVPKAKNSRVARITQQRYEVSKKELQLAVKRVAKRLGHLPNRKELTEYSEYPVKLYDEYFTSWNEIYAAARTTGMSEEPE